MKTLLEAFDFSDFINNSNTPAKFNFTDNIKKHIKTINSDNSAIQGSYYVILKKFIETSILEDKLKIHECTNKTENIDNIKNNILTLILKNTTINDGILTIGNISENNNFDYTLTFTDVECFHKFIELCKFIKVHKLINQTAITCSINDSIKDWANKQKTLDIVLEDFNFNHLTLSYVNLVKIKNIKFTYCFIRGCKFNDKCDISITSEYISLNNCVNYKNYKFIKSAKVLCLGYNASAAHCTVTDLFSTYNYIDTMPQKFNLYGLENANIEELRIRFDREVLPYYNTTFTTKYLPKTLKKLNVSLLEGNLNHFSFKYIPTDNIDIIVKADDINNGLLYKNIESFGLFVSVIPKKIIKKMLELNVQFIKYYSYYLQNKYGEKFETPKDKKAKLEIGAYESVEKYNIFIDP